MNKPYIDSISTKSESKYLLHEIDDDELTWEIGAKMSETVENEADLPSMELEPEAEEPALTEE